MDMHGYVQICTEMHGYAWICMDMQANTSKCMDMHGYAWIYMDMHGYAYPKGPQMAGPPEARPEFTSLGFRVYTL